MPTTRPAKLNNNLARLLERSGGGAKLGLDLVQEAAQELNNPQDDLRIVHVAGSNGKGSTCAMVEQVARNAGLKTGFFSSPHLCSFAERIRIDGRPVDDDLFADVLEQVLAPSMLAVSFFEAMFLAGMLAMKQSQVDLAIVEVGLGGRLDATNIIEHPAATAVTGIALDHTRILGDDLQSIAFEKSQIAKANVPMIVGAMAPESAAVVAEQAKRRSASNVIRVGHEIQLEQHASGARVTGPNARTLQVKKLGLAGAHQRFNAAVAAGLCWQLPEIGDDAIVAGLAAVRWPGRLERQGPVLFDCAHNQQGIEALCAYLDGQHPAEKTRVVFGVMEGKPWRPMLQALTSRAHSFVYCPPLEAVAKRRSLPPAQLAAVHPGTVCASPEEALSTALQARADDEVVVVCGSIFLVGAARAQLLGIPRDVILPL